MTHQNSYGDGGSYCFTRPVPPWSHPVPDVLFQEPPARDTDRKLGGPHDSEHNKEISVGCQGV